MTADIRSEQNALRKRAWDKKAETYDRQIGWFERHLFGEEHRRWACEQVSGDVLEVAVGTGLNLPLYGPGVRLTAVDLSPGMLAIARKRASDLGVAVDLREGDAHQLPFNDESFDAVVSTYSLCNIPDVAKALDEMYRVLRPEGKLVLVDHIRSTNKIVYGIQRVIELVSIRIDGDHMTRRPLEQARERGFAIADRQRARLGGIVERLVAVKHVSER